MITRRACLGAGGTALLGLSAGCLSSVFDSRTEYVQYRHLLVDVDTSDELIAEHPLLRLLSRRPGEIQGHVAEAHADIVDRDGTVSVSEDRHRSFEEAYAGVRYVASFCGGDLDSDGETRCRGTNVSRADFDAFQFGDAVTVDFDADGDGPVAARVTDVEPGSTDDWDVEIHTIEFPDEAE